MILFLLFFQDFMVFYMKNDVILSGKVKNVAYSHESHCESFYIATIDVQRTSGCIDEIPVMISEIWLNADSLVGKYITIEGSFRSHNIGRQLILFAFADNLKMHEKLMFNNKIIIDGFLCKEPVIRETPLGRTIADVMIAVNRRYGKSDYIPCVIWGRNAIYAGRQHVGAYVNICGRIQSRNYEKNSKIKTAYEISVTDFNVITS